MQHTTLIRIQMHADTNILLKEELKAGNYCRAIARNPDVLKVLCCEIVYRWFIP